MTSLSTGRAIAFIEAKSSRRDIELAISSRKALSGIDPLIELSVEKAPGRLLEIPVIMPMAIFAKNAGRDYFIEATATGMRGLVVAGALAAFLREAAKDGAFGLTNFEVVHESGGRFLYIG